jgi:multiple antibiotic resistance protein
MLQELSGLYLKMLVLYSPFFVLSCFISLTRGYTVKERKRLAWKVAFGSMIASVLLFLFGAGSVLFISALGMAQGKPAVHQENLNQDVTIVPLTIPLTVGPGTIGALLVMSASDNNWDLRLATLLAIVIASLTVGVVLYLSSLFERLMGEQGLQIVSRLMGLFVCALAAQIIFTGVKNYLNL